jgi:DNA-binding response OmpR family regulator
MYLLNIDDDADDSLFFMEAVKEISSDATCLVLSSGDNAVQFLSHDMGVLPDYIFLDINMPGMNGKECLVKLRSMRKLANVPIVMFSTSILDYDRQNFRKLNASACQKPYDFHSLKTVIKSIVIDGAEGRSKSAGESIL